MMDKWLDEYVEMVMNKQKVQNKIFRSGFLYRREKREKPKKPL